MKNKAWKYFSTTSTTFLSLMLGIASGLISARILGPEARGELATISYFPGIMGSFFCLAIPQALIFITSKYPERERNIISAGFRISFFLGIIGAVSFAIITPFILSGANRHLANAITIACLASPAMVITPHLEALNWGLKRFDWCNSIKIFNAFCYVLVLLALWFSDCFSPLSACLAAAFIQTFIALLHVWRLGFNNLVSKVSWNEYLELVRQGFKYFVPVLAVIVYGLSDRAILIRTTTLENIGYYTVAFSLTFPLSLAAEAFAQIGFVEIAAEKDSNTALSLTLRRFKMAQIVVVLASIGVISILYPMIYLGFGTKFLPALTASYIMIPAMALRGLSKSLEFSLRANNITWPDTLAGLISTISLVGLGVMLVSINGVNGFAIALLCAEVTAFTTLVYTIQRLLKVSISDLWGLRIDIFVDLLKSLSSLVNVVKTKTL